MKILFSISCFLLLSQFAVAQLANWFNFATTAPNSSMTPSYGLICNPIGIATLVEPTDQASMTFMPNPFANQTEIVIQVNTELLHQKANLSILNIQGQIVDQRTFLLNSNKQSISYQKELSAGVYFAILRVKGKLLRAEKIVVMK